MVASATLVAQTAALDTPQVRRADGPPPHDVNLNGYVDLNGDVTVRAKARAKTGIDAAGAL